MNGSYNGIFGGMCIYKAMVIKVLNEVEANL